MDIGVCTEDSDFGSKTIADNTANAIKSQLNKYDSEKLFNKEHYHENLKEASVESKPILKIYDKIYWELADKPLKDIISAAETASEKMNLQMFYVFDEEPWCITIRNQKASYTIKADYSVNTPKYILDIAAIPETAVLKNKKCHINGIYCFDMLNSYYGAIVYLDTSEGVYVQYYKDNKSEPILFSESEYAKLAVPYYNRITSYEYNYDENGAPKGGSPMTFDAFINELDANDAKKTDYDSIMKVVIISAFIIVVFNGCSAKNIQ